MNYIDIFSDLYEVFIVPRINERRFQSQAYRQMLTTYLLISPDKYVIVSVNFFFKTQNSYFDHRLSSIFPCDFE